MRRLRAGTLVLASALLAGSVGLGSATPTLADDAQPVPDLGHFVSHAGAGGPYVGVLHAVRRTSGVTVLYVSVGTTDPVMSGIRRGSDAFVGYGASSVDRIDVADSSLRLTRLVDPVAGKVYRPIQTRSAPECVCTPMNKDVPKFDERTQLVTFAAAFPALPASVTRVDVDVTGEGLVLPDIPVSDGAPLSPAVGAGTAVLLGHGWPRLDLAAAAAVKDVRPFVADLVTRETSTDNTIRSRQSGAESRIDIASDVLFAVDKATLSAAARARLTTVAGRVRQASATMVRVTGYTDDTGTARHNQGLSERRAASVVAALRRLVPSASFVAAGRGERDPVASNDGAAGRALNRRVTVQFATGGANR